MAGEALRQLIASFTVEVDPTGALPRGNAAVDAFKAKLIQTDAAAKQTAASISTAMVRVEQSVRKAAAALGSGGGAKLLGAGGGGALAPVGGALARLGAGGGLGGIPTLDSLFGGRGGGGGRGGLGAGLIPGPDGLGRLTAFVKKIGTLNNALAALGAGAAFAGVKGLVDHIGGIGEAAAKLGVSNAEFQRLNVLAKQNAASVQALGTAFRTLATNAVNPTDESTEALHRLGVQVKADDGTFKTRQDLFFETATALADVQDETVRAALAQKLYGRSALELAPLLAAGRAGIEAQRDELAKLPVVSDAVIAAADRFSDGWEATMQRLMALAGPVLEDAVIPALNLLMSSVNGLTEAFTGVNVKSLAFTGALVLLVPKVATLYRQMQLLVGLSGGWGKFFSNIGGGLKSLRYSTGALVAQFLLLEDIFTFFTGGDSLTGDAIDKLFGEGVSLGVQKTVKDLTEAFKDLWKWILGDGAGDKAKTLFAEIGQGLELLIHDALVQVGVRKGETGLAGLEAYKAGKAGSGLSTAGKLLGGVDPSDPFHKAIAASFAAQKAGRAGTTVIEAPRTVTVHMGANASPGEVAKRVGVELERDRAAVAAGVP